MIEDQIMELPVENREWLMRIPEHTREIVYRLFIMSRPLLNLQTFQVKGFVRFLEWFRDKRVAPIQAIVYEGDLELSQILLCLLVKARVSTTPLYMSPILFMDICMGKNEQCPSIASAGRDLLCLYLGFNDPPNKSLEAWTCHVLETRYIENRKFWVIIRGINTLQKFPVLHALVNRLGNVYCCDRGADGVVVDMDDVPIQEAKKKQSKPCNKSKFEEDIDE